MFFHEKSSRDGKEMQFLTHFYSIMNTNKQKFTKPPFFGFNHFKINGSI